MPELVVMLVSSVLFIVIKNVISKKMGKDVTEFYTSQTLLFGAGTIVMLLANVGKSWQIHPLMLLYGGITALLFVGSIWTFTYASHKGNTSVCSTINSLSFIIPTLAGVLFWDDSFTPLSAVGITLVLIALVLNSVGAGGSKGTKLATIAGTASMITGGGIGVMQKV